MRALVLALALFPLATFADAVDVSFNPTGLRGKTLPQVHVHILEPIAGFKLNLVRSDVKKLTVKGGGRPGVTRTIDLDTPEGKFGWKGVLTINLPNADQASMPMEFETELYGPLVFSFDKDTDADIEHRKVTVHINHPAAKADLKVLMDTGDYAFNGEVDLSGKEANEPLTLTWPEAKGNVMKVYVRVYDTAGFYNGVELTPWSIDIPHEEVNFDFGKWDVLATERPKLDKSYALIADALTKYGHLADIRLYIAGHTDTVGTNASNKTLSLNRARAIGKYFRQKGLRIPIYVEGFGEEALAVSTPDETPEPKNRRAEYTLSIDDPGAKKTAFHPHWQRL